MEATTTTTSQSSSLPWLDKIETRWNACSLEVLYHSFHDPSNEERQQSDDESRLRPLVIGCYELSARNANDDDAILSNDMEDGTNDDGKDGPILQRSGELRLYMIPIPGAAQFGDPVHIVPTESGILDGTWFQRCPLLVDDGDEPAWIYATACASGKISIYQLYHHRHRHDDGTAKSHSTYHGLKRIASSTTTESDKLCLSLALDEFPSDRDTVRIVSSYSDGSIALHALRLDDDTEPRLKETRVWNDAHTLPFHRVPAEVWTCSFATNSHYDTHRNTILSGGDDCRLKLWDIRSSSPHSVHGNGIEKELLFGAGVTSISYHTRLEHVFAVGGYEERIRLYDMRMMERVLCESDELGGGIWRMKWHPTNDALLLVACMHGGCRLLRVPHSLERGGELFMDGEERGGELFMDGEEHGGGTIEIVKEFKEHTSMVYGADWVFVEEDDNNVGNVNHYDTNGNGEENEIKTVMASCSFYDRMCVLWNSS